LCYDESSLLVIWALRDYGDGNAIVWGGDENCEHDFEIIENKSPTDRGGKSQYDNGKYGDWKDTTKPNYFGFCNKCGAWKGQLGLEPTFDQYISNLCDIFDEVKRVLRDDGTCWVNIGDSYYGSGGTSGQKEGTKNLGYDTHKMGAVSQNEIKKEWDRPSRKAFNESGINKKCLECGVDIKTGNNGQFCSRECLNKQSNDFRSQNRLLPNKCLVGIPFRFALEMCNRGWILRNTIIWHKPNCMPSSVKDRFTVDFEYIFFFSKKKKYYFETQLEPLAESTKADKRLDKGLVKHKSGKSNQEDCQYAIKGMCANSKGRNKRTVWSICPKPFREAHFAVYPEELCETPIKAGCPEFVCVKCGMPKIMEYKSNRNTKKEKRIADEKTKKSSSQYGTGKVLSNDQTTGMQHRDIGPSGEVGMYNKTEVVGYKPTCKCNVEFTGGVVLDPFFGAGTTGLVALKQNKSFIGIELNPEYIEIAEKRLKPFMEQTTLNLNKTTEDKNET